MKTLCLVFVAAGTVLAVGLYTHTPRPQDISPATNPEEVESTQQAPIGAAQAAPVKPKQPAEIPSAQAPDAHEGARPTAASTGVAGTNPRVDAAFVAQAVDLLVSTQATRQQKQDMWKQLRNAGKLDQVITELEQRVTNDPRTAEYQAALGQAYLKKCGTIGDMREQGILAMQADKLFDTALTLDPSNWEARFTKAVGMSYWPPVMNKGEEVIQNFQTLIEQQEAQPAQPHFAETYAWLGDQYQKSGKTDDAQAIWKRGAALFPTDEKLQAKLASKP